MSEEYTHNHYVPEWYQKRFLLPGSKHNELYYLDLQPPVYIDHLGKGRLRPAVRRQGLRLCFAEDNLYTRNIAGSTNIEIEKYFFGDIDTKGRRAVDYFAEFTHPSVSETSLRDMLHFMSSQKLRTPKGLDWLKSITHNPTKGRLLYHMVDLRDLFCATWTECIWQVADCSQSDTKFIISDHPVTVYNRACHIKSGWCHGFTDPDILLQATHTIFPLNLEKILILTNLSWLRNPYQKPTKLRPNPVRYRSTIFNFMQIQISRKLSETEVRQINFIIKSRAYRYLASAKEEWLYPEKFVSKSDWSTFGDGYLLMPDPRAVNFGGEIIWGNADGTGGAMDAYGRKPWNPDYNKEANSMREFRTLHRFQGEFARIYGRKKRGVAFEVGGTSSEEYSEKMHQLHLYNEAAYK